MKNILLFFITLFLTVSVNAQSLVGKWKINFLITEQDISEYVINKPNEEDTYGNHLSINKNGTFSTSYSAWCGNDCFTTTSGTYTMIGENYIRFFLKNISHSGECEGNSNPNKDIGLYYIHREEISLDY